MSARSKRTIIYYSKQSPVAITPSLTSKSVLHMKKKIEIGQSSDIYVPNFNRSEIGRPIFSRLGFGRSRSDFFFGKRHH